MISTSHTLHVLQPLYIQSTPPLPSVTEHLGCLHTPIALRKKPRSVDGSWHGSFAYAWQDVRRLVSHPGYIASAHWLIHSISLCSRLRCSAVPRACSEILSCYRDFDFDFDFAMQNTPHSSWSRSSTGVTDGIHGSSTFSPWLHRCRCDLLALVERAFERRHARGRPSYDEQPKLPVLCGVPKRGERSYLPASVHSWWERACE